MTRLSIRHSLLAALLPLLIVTPARAQGHDDTDDVRACGEAEDSFQADRVFHFISGIDPELRRGLAAAGIVTQASTAPHGVLRDAKLCAALRAALPQHINSFDVSTKDLKDARLSFLELGDYLGVIVINTKPTQTGVVRRGAAPVYIFTGPNSKRHDDRGRENEHERGNHDDKGKVRFVARVAI